MAHFAELDNDNNVLRVIVVNNNDLLLNGKENEQKGIDFCIGLFGGNWIQTSYNHKIRKQFAGIGYKYDADADVFIAPKPFLSWTLDVNHNWIAPKPYPVEGIWNWNEEIGDWVEAEAL